MRICANNQLSLFVWVLSMPYHFLSRFSPFHRFLYSFFLTKFHASLSIIIFYLPSTIPVFHSSILCLIALSKTFLFFLKPFRHHRHRGTVKNRNTLTKYRYFSLQLTIFSGKKRELDNGVTANAFEELLRIVAVQGANKSRLRFTNLYVEETYIK